MKDNFVYDSKRAQEFFTEKISYCVSPFELKEKIEKYITEINIIDAREYDDYIDGHIPYAIHIPLNNFYDHITMLVKDKINIVYSYCPYCKKAYKAAKMIAAKDYPVMVLNGGIMIWKELNYDIVKTSTN